MTMERKNLIIAAVGVIFVTLVAVAAFLFWPKPGPETETVPKGNAGQNSSSTSGSSDTGGSSGSADTSSGSVPAKRTNTEVLDSIIKQKPSLVDANQQPIFNIVSSVRTPSAWYVVTIVNTQDPSVGKAKIVMKDSND